jgi:putative phosphoesterase
MKFAIFSDIHANLTALQACYDHFIDQNIEAKIVILGDYIDYGPRPNETVTLIQKMNPYIVLCGNHEKALDGNDDTRFSSQRGVRSIQLTQTLLNEDSKNFIAEHPNAFCEDVMNERKILFVHGDLSDIFWGKMPFTEMQKNKYMVYDFVISGHTHIPHFVEILYDTENPDMRNKKKTVFLNPGSVGQPRNHCKYAQYMLLNTHTEEITFYKIPYNISSEQSYFSSEMDVFYKERLNNGI